MPRDTENGQPAKRLRTGCQWLHRPSAAPAASIEGGCTATVGVQSNANRGAAPHRPRLHRPSKRTGQPATATGRQHRRRLHGHGWRPIERERPTEGLPRPLAASKRLRTAPATAASGCTGHALGTEGLHRPTGHWSPALKAAAHRNRPRLHRLRLAASTRRSTAPWLRTPRKFMATEGLRTGSQHRTCLLSQGGGRGAALLSDGTRKGCVAPPEYR